MRGLDVAEIQAGGLTIDATMDVTIAQPLTGAGGITKVNTMTTFLTGPNTYAGSTLVQEGKLVLPTVQTNAASILVATGAELGVARAVPNASLTAGSLSLGASTLSFDLGTLGNPTAPLANVTTLAASGGAGSVTVNVSGGLGLLPGQFTLVDYSGAIGGSGFGAFTLVGLPPGVVATLVNNAANSSIDLNITAAPGLRWTGANGSSWDYLTMNWFDYAAGANSAYTDNQPTWFLDGAATGIVDVSSALRAQPDDRQQHLAALRFERRGSLFVPSLIKSGAGSLTRVDGAADLVAQIELNAGSYVSSNTYDAALSTVLTDTSAGLGTFVKERTGRVDGVSPPTAHTTAPSSSKQGVLKVGATEALGSTNGTVTVVAGASLDVNDLQSPHKPVIVSGAGFGGQGAITESSGVGGGAAQPDGCDPGGRHHLRLCPNGRWDIRVRTGSGPGPGLRGNGLQADQGRAPAA